MDCHYIEWTGVLVCLPEGILQATWHKAVVPARWVKHQHQNELLGYSWVGIHTPVSLSLWKTEWKWKCVLSQATPFSIFIRIGVEDLETKPHKSYLLAFWIVKAFSFSQPIKISNEAFKQELSSYLSQSLGNRHTNCNKGLWPCTWHNDIRFPWQLWPAGLLGPHIAACNFF